MMAFPPPFLFRCTNCTALLFDRRHSRAAQPLGFVWFQMSVSGRVSHHYPTISFFSIPACHLLTLLGARSSPQAGRALRDDVSSSYSKDRAVLLVHVLANVLDLLLCQQRVGSQAPRQLLEPTQISPYRATDTLVQ